MEDWTTDHGNRRQRRTFERSSVGTFNLLSSRAKFQISNFIFHILEPAREKCQIRYRFRFRQQAIKTENLPFPLSPSPLVSQSPCPLVSQSPRPLVSQSPRPLVSLSALPLVPNHPSSTGEIRRRLKERSKPKKRGQETPPTCQIGESDDNPRVSDSRIPALRNPDGCERLF